MKLIPYILIILSIVMVTSTSLAGVGSNNTVTKGQKLLFSPTSKFKNSIINHPIYETKTGATQVGCDAYEVNAANKEGAQHKEESRNHNFHESVAPNKEWCMDITSVELYENMRTLESETLDLDVIGENIMKAFRYKEAENRIIDTNSIIKSHIQGLLNIYRDDIDQLVNITQWSEALRYIFQATDGDISKIDHLRIVYDDVDFDYVLPSNYSEDIYVDLFHSLLDFSPLEQQYIELLFNLEASNPGDASLEYKISFELEHDGYQFIGTATVKMQYDITSNDHESISEMEIAFVTHNIPTKGKTYYLKDKDFINYITHAELKPTLQASGGYSVILELDSFEFINEDGNHDDIKRVIDELGYNAIFISNEEKDIFEYSSDIVGIKNLAEFETIKDQYNNLIYQALLMAAGSEFGLIEAYNSYISWINADENVLTLCKEE